MKSNYLVVIALVFAMLAPGFGYGDGENFLFYNSTTGEGAVGKLMGDEFRTTKTYPSGAFAKWTHIAWIDSLHSILFYNTETGAGAVGALDRGDFKTTNTRNDFSLGWTHILDAHLHHHTVSLPLFYNSATGSGAVGYAPTVRSYPNGAFARGWTHIVANWSGMLFYNSRTGEGAVAVPIDSSPKGLRNIDNIKTVKVYKRGDFATNWTHVVSAGSSILFYNSADGSGAIGKLVPNIVSGATAFQTDTTYPAGSFTRGWTHVVPAGKSNKVLFYNGSTGEGAVGEISDSRFKTTKTYSKNAFARGWTHVVATSFDTPPSLPPR